VTGRDDAVLAGIAQLMAPGAHGSALVSVVARDGVPGPLPTERLAVAYARHRLTLLATRPATPAEVAASHSSWAKRLLGPGAARPVTRIEFERAG
jgi:hypothetical protein